MHIKLHKTWKNIPFLLTAGINILLLLAVVYLMRYVQSLLDSDAKINLTEVVTQNKNVITGKLMLQMNTLALLSDQLSERLKHNPNPQPPVSQMQTAFLALCREKTQPGLTLADSTGQAVDSNGTGVDIAGRQYYRLAMRGIRNISERTVSRLDGKDIFVISIPVYHHGEIIGTLQKAYSPQEMYELCAVPLFSEKGHIYIINESGYILFTSQHKKYSRESENFFRLLYADNESAAKCLENDVLHKRSGFMEAEIDGEKTFSAYTPIDEIYDWYLISSVATHAVSPNGAIIIKLFYVVLLVVVSTCTFSMLYFIAYKNKQHANLERAAFVDPITGGRTYSKFILDAQAALSNPHSKCRDIFTFDLDNFKYVNNFYGFDMGDVILRRLYEIITSKLRPGELLARIYSDHYVALLENADQERLQALLESMPSIEGIKLYFSAGLYHLTDVQENINLMVDKANMAARSIKDASNRQIEVYSDVFDEQLIKNEQLKRAFEEALRNDEITPFYQPKVNIHTGRLEGAEALARWITADGKLIPPNDFIPLCETTGLIIDVDMIIFEKTLQFMRAALDAGVACTPISINFSRLHFQDKDFIERVSGLADVHGVPARLIEIEVTESIIFENTNIISDFISALQKRGFQISMDDFGSGYSSLNMLKDVFIDVLKIDRAFLKGTVNSVRQKAIFAAIAQMAHKLDIKIVVEGVENLENIALMKEFDCTIAQGYYYAKPMNAESFRPIYQAGKVC